MDATPHDRRPQGRPPDPSQRPTPLGAGGDRPIIPPPNQNAYDVDTVVVDGILQLTYDGEVSDQLLCRFSEVLSGGSLIQIEVLDGWELEKETGNLLWIVSGPKIYTTLTEQMLYDVVVSHKELGSDLTFVEQKSGIRAHPRVRVSRLPSQDP